MANFLTKKEDEFIQGVYLGEDVVPLYRKVFGVDEEDMPNSRVRYEAMKIQNRKAAKLRIIELQDQYREKSDAAMRYKFEDGVFDLRYWHNKIISEVERVEQAAMEELQYLEELYMEAPTDAKRREVLELILKKRQYKHLSQPQLKGVTDIIGELNKMHGFNDTHITHGGQVTFVGTAADLEEAVGYEDVEDEAEEE